MNIHLFSRDLGVDTQVIRNAIARVAGRGPAHAPRRDAHPNAPHPNAPQAPSASGEGAAPRSQPIAAPPIDEVELLALLADHPSLIATPEADKAFWLLTDDRLRAIYTAAREGASVLELAPGKLPPPSAQHVLSGKYADAKDPRAQLVAMSSDLERRKVMLGQAELKKNLIEAQRRGDRVLARLLAQLAEAQRKGDLELASRLEDEISSNRKQAD